LKAGAAAEERLKAGAAAEERLKAGAAAEERLKAGADAEEKLKAGAAAKEELKAGAAAEEKLKAGAAAEEKLKAGAAAEEELKAGAGAAAEEKLKPAGAREELDAAGKLPPPNAAIPKIGECNRMQTVELGSCMLHLRLALNGGARGVSCRLQQLLHTPFQIIGTAFRLVWCPTPASLARTLHSAHWPRNRLTQPHDERASWNNGTEFL
jgi:hypothetical protein